MPRAFSSGAASIASYALNSPPKRSAPILVSAAVSVVLPWSTWPMVPTFTCGLVRSNLPLDMAAYLADVLCWVTAWLAIRRLPPDPVREPREWWCSRMESNHRPPPYQGGALPTELREHRKTCFYGTTRAAQWSGRRESNPHHQLGRLRFYH